MTTFNVDSKTVNSSYPQRTSLTSKSFTSIFENINSECTPYSTRNSVMESAHRGDSNNNFNLQTDDGESDSENEENNMFFNINKLKRLARRKIASTKFKNIQTEMLYQRYWLRMNQHNATYIVWLLSALIFILTVIHIKFFVDRWNRNIECINNATKEFNDDIFQMNILLSSNFSLEERNSSLINESIPLNIFSESTNCENFDKLLSTNFIQFSLLGICSILYIILLLCLYKRKINEIYLFHVSYAIIISLVIIDISFSITNMGE